MEWAERRRLEVLGLCAFVRGIVRDEEIEWLAKRRLINSVVVPGLQSHSIKIEYESNPTFNDREHVVAFEKELNEKANTILGSLLLIAKAGGL